MLLSSRHHIIHVRRQDELDELQEPQRLALNQTPSPSVNCKSMSATLHAWSTTLSAIEAAQVIVGVAAAPEAVASEA